MARQKGTANLAASLEVLAGAPLDARTKVALKADLTASGTFPYPYEGMKVYVAEEHKYYTLIGNDPTVSANWQEDGSGGGTEDYSDLINKPQINGITLNADKSLDDLGINQHSLFEDTIGWECKNLLPLTVDKIKTSNSNAHWTAGNTYTLYGVTMTVLTDSENRVTGLQFDGTSDRVFDFAIGNAWGSTDAIIDSGKYALYLDTDSEIKCFVGYDNSTLGTVNKDTSKATIEAPNGISWCLIRMEKDEVLDGVIIRPVLCHYDVKNEDFVPYSKNVKETINDDKNSLHNDLINTIGYSCKNQIPYPYQDGVSKSSAGITYTVDENGIIDCDGTATAISAFIILWTTAKDFYKYNGLMLSSGSSDDVSCRLEILSTDSYKTYSNTYGGERLCNGYMDIPNDDTPMAIRIAIAEGTTLNHKKIKPMIYDKNLYNGDYAPHKDSVTDIKFDSINDRPTKNVTSMDNIITPLPSIRPRQFKYSTDEQVVGEWIDGKPLYQKTFFVELSGQNVSVPHQINNIGFRQITELVLRIVSLDKYFYLIDQLSEGTFSISSDSLIIATKSAAWNNGCQVWITIRYTKTTD